MLAITFRPVAALLTALASALRRPSIAIAFCYAAGLLADLSAGGGPMGAPFSLAAPAVAGMVLRLRRGLRVSDLGALAIAHLVVAGSAGQGPAAMALGFAENLVWVAVAALIFGQLRVAGFISSQYRTVAAAAIAAAGGQAAYVLLAIAVEGEAAVWAALHARWLAGALSGGLLLVLVLVFDRDDQPIGAALEQEDAKPSRWEFLLAALSVAMPVVAAVALDLQEAALVSSVMLLWHALRLGLLPTALASFAFADTLLLFGGDLDWPAVLGSPGTLEAELLRCVAIGLLSWPAVLVAAVVSDHRRARRIYAHRATHDGLTQLANRSRFLDVLERAALDAREGGRRFVLLLIDLDHFKSVNDTFGHARGDALLVEVSTRLRGSLRATDVVARIGGDEFAVVAPVRTAEDAMGLAKRLVEAINQRTELEGIPYAPSITVGGVLAPDSSTNPQRLMRLADEALYQAKAAGRNCWRFTSSETAGELVIPAWLLETPEPAPQIVYLD